MSFMHCNRCQGSMIEDQCFDFEGTQGFMWMKGWRCMNCGHAVDPVIEANHPFQAATLLVRPCQEPEAKHEHRGPKPSHGLRHDDEVMNTPTHMKEFLW